MGSLQGRVEEVEKGVRRLEESRHPRSREAQDCQARLSRRCVGRSRGGRSPGGRGEITGADPCRWEAFGATLEEKKKEVDSAVGLNNYGLECVETGAWIRDKTRAIESTRELGDDLAAVMAVQRKLFGVERDLAAIGAKLDFLRGEAERLAGDRPEDAGHILERRAQLEGAWAELKRSLKDREESLGEVSKLQTFLGDMDHFQAWLFRTQKAVASEEAPASLPEAEEQLGLHRAMRRDIRARQEDYHRVREAGAQVTRGQEADPQYQQLEQRLLGLDRGWDELQRMWDSRKQLLDQALGFQHFSRDCKAVEAILNNQVRQPGPGRAGPGRQPL